MDFNSKDMGPDALDELLRKLLLEQNPEGPDGQSLLEQASGTVFGEAPLVLPDPHRELQMITRLQEEFGTAAQPAPVPAEPVPSERRRLGFWLPFGAVAAAAAVALLWAFWPAGTTPADPSTAGIASTTAPPPAGGSTALPAAGHSTPVDAQPAIIMPHTGANPFPSVNTGSSPLTTPQGPAVPAPQPRILPGTQQPASQPLYTSSQPVFTGTPQPLPANNTFLNPMAMASMEVLRTRIAPEGIKRVIDDPTHDFFFQTDQGTLVHIPAMCFRDAEGKPVETPVTLYMKEIYKRSDFLRADVVTETFGQPMAAAAAVEFTAYAGNKVLSVRDGKEIYVEFGKLTASGTRSMDMMSSTDVQRAGNWQLSQGRQSRMLTIPSEQLHFDEFWCDCRADAQWNQVLYDLTQPQYQNTWISTLEFRRRLEAMAAMDYQSEALSMYRDNIRLDLWRVDKLVADKYAHSRMRTPDNKELMEDVFQRFSQEMLTQAEDAQTGNRNFDLPNIYSQLLAQNLSEQEADRLTRIYRLRGFYSEEVGKAYAKAIENEKNKRNPTLRMGSMASHLKDRPGFFIRQTGWTTLAKSLNTGNGAELRVELSGVPANASVRTWVVYGDMLSVLSARMTGLQSARLHDAPLSQKAWIVSVAWDGNMAWYGIQGLHIDGERNELLVLQAIDPDRLVQAFQALDRF